MELGTILFVSYDALRWTVLSNIGKRLASRADGKLKALRTYIRSKEGVVLTPPFSDRVSRGQGSPRLLHATASMNRFVSGSPLVANSQLPNPQVSPALPSSSTIASLGPLRFPSCDFSLLPNSVDRSFELTVTVLFSPCDPRPDRIRAI